MLQVQSRSSSQPRRGPWRIRLSPVAQCITHRRHLCPAMESPWSSPRLELLPPEQPMVGQEGWGSCAHGDLCRALLKDGPCGTESCWSSAWRAAAVGRPRGISLGRTASVGETSCGAGAEQHKVLRTDCRPYSLFLCAACSNKIEESG